MLPALDIRTRSAIHACSNVRHVHAVVISSSKFMFRDRLKLIKNTDSMVKNKRTHVRLYSLRSTACRTRNPSSIAQLQKKMPAAPLTAKLHLSTRHAYLNRSRNNNNYHTQCIHAQMRVVVHNAQQQQQRNNTPHTSLQVLKNTERR